MKVVFRSIFFAAAFVSAGTQSHGQTCGDFCKQEFWISSSHEKIQASMQNIDVNARNERRDTPLLAAAAWSNLENILLLLDAGADVNARNSDGNTPLLLALRGHADWTITIDKVAGKPFIHYHDSVNPRIISSLINAGANLNVRNKYGSSPLDTAADSVTPDNILLLLKAGAEPSAGEDGTNVLLHRLAAGSLDWSSVTEDADGELLTGKSVYASRDTVLSLIEAGANVNARDNQGRTPLHAAANSYNLEMRSILLDSGADINARDVDGLTPLHLLAKGGPPEHIQTFLEAGAEINARDVKGRTPLHFAAVWGTSMNIKLLLESGADWSFIAEQPYFTPLHSAAGFGRKPANVLALLDAGADAAATNVDGETPWDMAQDNENLRNTRAYWALNDARFR